MPEQRKESVIIKGIGAYKPQKILTNDQLSQMVDTSDEWIQTRTGIKTRHIADKDEFTSHMGTKAAKQAIQRANLDIKDIDLIIVATITPDAPFPSTACYIQHQLGARPIPAFDVQAACAGFPYCIDIATNMLLSGNYQNALIIGSEKLSSIIDWQDRSTCVLFGDGAGAIVLSKANNPNTGIIGTTLGSDGSKSEILCQTEGGSAHPITLNSINNRSHYLKMNGPEIFKVAVRFMEKAIKEVLIQNNRTIEDIDLIIPHQANIRIIEALANRLKTPTGKIFTNLAEVGNTSAASIPLALNDAFEANQIKSGNTLLFVAFGAGLTWGSTIVKWH